MAPAPRAEPPAQRLSSSGLSHHDHRVVVLGGEGTRHGHTRQEWTDLIGVDDQRSTYGPCGSGRAGRGRRVGSRPTVIHRRRDDGGPPARGGGDARLFSDPFGVTVDYDAGVFIAAERNDREVWADHRARLEVGIVPVTTAPVVAQVSRSARQVPLRRLLEGCEIVAFSSGDAHDVGALLDRASSSDVVDAHVVVVAARRRAVALTADTADLQRLADNLPEPVTVLAV